MLVFRVLAILFSLLILGLYAFGISGLYDSDPFRFWLLAALGVLVPVFFLLRYWLRLRRRRQWLAKPFPEAYRSILQKQVDFYRLLSPADRKRFEKAVQTFLVDVDITGIDTEVDDRVRVLTAASAVIPIFGFPDWRYRNLREVLIYPGAFNSQNYAQEGPDRNALGMVGTGAMSGKVILSLPALLNGFHREGDGKNTGIHEFVHLLDASDGSFDGVPGLLDKKYVLPWLGMMHREMKRIRRGKSRLRNYGASNKVEFFAVASEYFFERPDELRIHHPKLYHLLKKIFRQDLRRQFSPASLRKLGLSRKE